MDTLNNMTPQTNGFDTPVDRTSDNDDDNTDIDECVTNEEDRVTVTKRKSHRAEKNTAPPAKKGRGRPPKVKVKLERRGRPSRSKKGTSTSNSNKHKVRKEESPRPSSPDESALQERMSSEESEEDSRPIHNLPKKRGRKPRVATAAKQSKQPKPKKIIKQEASATSVPAIIMKMKDKSQQNRIFICTLCCLSFPHQKAAMKHMSADHKITSSYLRMRHFKLFVTPLNVDSHPLVGQMLTMSSDDRPKNICPYCLKLFNTRRELENDVQSHLADPDPLLAQLDKSPDQYECHSCDKLFQTSMMLLKHFNMDHEFRHTCEHCSRHFPNGARLKAHLLTHTGEKNFICQTCGKGFRQKSHLITHESVHTGQKYCCQHCGKMIRIKAMMNQHIRRYHSDLVPNMPPHVFRTYKCELCPYTTKWHSNYSVHKRKHGINGGRVFQCRACGKSFAQKSTLLTHWSGHIQRGMIPEGSVAVVEDGMDAPPLEIRAQAKIRKRDPMKPRPYACEICEKTFTQKTGLKFHLMAHTGNFQFRCRHCHRSFIQKEGLKQHWKTHVRRGDVDPYAPAVLGDGAEVTPEKTWAAPQAAEKPEPSQPTIQKTEEKYQEIIPIPAQQIAGMVPLSAANMPTITEVIQATQYGIPSGLPPGSVVTIPAGMAVQHQVQLPSGHVVLTQTLPQVVAGMQSQTIALPQQTSTPVPEANTVVQAASGTPIPQVQSAIAQQGHVIASPTPTQIINADQLVQSVPETVTNEAQPVSLAATSPGATWTTHGTDMQDWWNKLGPVQQMQLE